MVAVSYYLLQLSDWVTFRLLPIVITVGFGLTVVNDVREMCATS